MVSDLSMKTKDLEKITLENARHIEIMNSEMGELRDAQKETKTEVSNVKAQVITVNTTVAEVKNDVGWLKQFFWIVATSSIGALVTGLLNLLSAK